MGQFMCRRLQLILFEKFQKVHILGVFPFATSLLPQEGSIYFEFFTGEVTTFGKVGESGCLGMCRECFYFIYLLFTFFFCCCWGTKIKTISIGGNAKFATFHTPYGVAIADDGTLYVADFGNNKIRKITSSGILS